MIVRTEQDRETVIEKIRRLNLDKQPWKIEARPYRKDRSAEQNAALWGVAYPPIMEATGLRGEKDKEELHEYMCGEYFGWVEYSILGKRKVRPRRTTTTNEDGNRDLLDTVVMADFYGFVQQRAAENGIYVPDPERISDEQTR